jgi:hypothetical protein
MKMLNEEMPEGRLGCESGQGPKKGTKDLRKYQSIQVQVTTFQMSSLGPKDQLYVLEQM